MTTREPTLYDILSARNDEVILPMVTYADARFILGADFWGTRRRVSAHYGLTGSPYDRILVNLHPSTVMA